MQVNEIIKNVKRYVKLSDEGIDVYHSIDRTTNFHTDNLKGFTYRDDKKIDCSNLNEVGYLEFIDYEVMNADDYNTTVLANAGADANDFLEDGEFILVILV